MIPLLIGWIFDLLFGDPRWLPHPVVGFGKMIAFCEKRLNHGTHRQLKGALVAIVLISMVFVLTYCLLRWLSGLSAWAGILVSALFIFYCLAGTTLIREVREVFSALDRSLEEGRRQVSRIVGRDTTQLSVQEVCTAALETLAENLSDGVIAPLFWLALLGVPGMLTYKMVNTLDSMIGYQTVRYKEFGCWAAHIDDIVNYIPARLTALLMVIVDFHPSVWVAHLRFIRENGRNHASPNSGYPEAALAAILDCRFGGPHEYFGELFVKPYIGTNDRQLTAMDMRKAVRINRFSEIVMVLVVTLLLLFITNQ